MTIKKRNSYYFGFYAEFIAAIFLFCKGYKILHKRYKNYCGEVDLIARKHNLLVAVEVKARKKILVADEVLSDYQKRRIKRAMIMFLSFNQHKFSNCGVRFDLIIIIPFKWPLHLMGFWE